MFVPLVSSWGSIEIQGMNQQLLVTGSAGHLGEALMLTFRAQRALLEEAVAAGVESFIYTSTTSTFGAALAPAAGEPAAWITEEVVPVPKNIIRRRSLPGVVVLAGAGALLSGRCRARSSHRSGLPVALVPGPQRVRFLLRIEARFQLSLPLRRQRLKPGQRVAHRFG